MKKPLVKEKRPTPEKPVFTLETLPPLLTAQHVRWICSCSRSTAYEIMQQPHRQVWQKDGIRRLLKEPFLEQIANECKRAI